MTYRTDDCASGLHDYCNVCECECHSQRVQRLHDELVKAANEIARLRAEIRQLKTQSNIPPEFFLDQD